MKVFGWIYTVVLVIILGCGFFLGKCSVSSSNYFTTNSYLLTNYIKAEKPVYVDVYRYITNISYITNSTNGVDVVIVIPIDSYSNLIFVLQEYSNYVNSDIVGIISNDNTITMIHYKNTNVVKLPNLCKNKVNLISVGYTLRGKLYLGYGYQFFNTKMLDLGLEAFGLGNFKENDYDVGIKLNGRF